MIGLQWGDSGIAGGSSHGVWTMNMNITNGHLFSFITTSTGTVQVTWWDGSTSTATGNQTWSKAMTTNGSGSITVELITAGVYTDIQIITNPYVTLIDLSNVSAVDLTGSLYIITCNPLDTLLSGDFSNLTLIDISRNGFLDTWSGTPMLNFVGESGSSTGSENFTSLDHNDFDATLLNTIFTNVGHALPFEVLEVAGNPGAGTCNPSIATAKGWAVRTS